MALGALDFIADLLFFYLYQVNDHRYGFGSRCCILQYKFVILLAAYDTQFLHQGYLTFRPTRNLALGIAPEAVETDP
jgi:hypothetical protein